MREIADGAFAYIVGAYAATSQVLWTHASDITTIGGLLVLGLRLYVDGSRAWKKWKGTDE